VGGTMPTDGEPEDLPGCLRSTARRADEDAIAIQPDPLATPYNGGAALVALVAHAVVSRIGLIEIHPSHLERVADPEPAAGVEAGPPHDGECLELALKRRLPRRGDEAIHAAILLVLRQIRDPGRGIDARGLVPVAPVARDALRRRNARGVRAA